MPHVKFYVVPCEMVAGRWQVLAEVDQHPARCMEYGLSKRAALKVMAHMERAALVVGAVVGA